MNKKGKSPFPKFPKPPAFPDTPQMQNIPKGQSGMGGGGAMPMDGGVQQIIQGIMQGMASGPGSGAISQEQIRHLMENWDIDQYRDANGKIRCPVSQEERDKLKDWIAKMSQGR